LVDPLLYEGNSGAWDRRWDERVDLYLSLFGGSSAGSAGSEGDAGSPQRQQRSVLALPEVAKLPLAARCSCPERLFQLLVSQYGEEKAFGIAVASNGVRGACLRVAWR
jgi:hypothetical protein